MAGKYAFDRSYYENRARMSYNGNAARQLDYAPETEELDESYAIEEASEREAREYAAPARRERRTEREAYIEAPQKKERYVFKLDTFVVLVFTIAIAMTLISAFRFLEVKSNISETDKMIKKAEARLDDVTSLNASLSSALDVEIDRDYIYTVAVAKLGMVYPNQNQVVYYEPASVGYVRQLSTIPVR